MDLLPFVVWELCLTLNSDIANFREISLLVRLYLPAGMPICELLHSMRVSWGSLDSAAWTSEAVVGESCVRVRWPRLLNSHTLDSFAMPRPLVVVTDFINPPLTHEERWVDEVGNNDKRAGHGE